MAPESIFQCVYTVQSDVWSYRGRNTLKGGEEEEPHDDSDDKGRSQ